LHVVLKKPLLLLPEILQDFCILSKERTSPISQTVHPKV